MLIFIFKKYLSREYLAELINYIDIHLKNFIIFSIISFNYKNNNHFLNSINSNKLSKIA